jgi:nucleoid-associated protein YgaU
MPVSITSRYYLSDVYDADDAQGVSHATIAIRPPTPPDPSTVLYSHMVTGSETIEYLAWRYYGDSSLWWQIAEANDLIFPTDIKAGMALSIPSASNLGTVVRNRSFS